MLNNINPLNNTLADKLSGMQNQIDTLNRARQYYQSDWHEISEPATGTNTYTISMTNLPSVAGFCQVGDKIRFKQGGAYIYGYVWANSVNFISVVGSSTAIVTAGQPVTDLAISKFNNPIGHPIKFSFTGTVYCNGSMTVSPTTLSYFYYMVGAIVFVTAPLTTFTLGGVANTDINLTTPTQIDLVQTVGIFVNHAKDNGTTEDCDCQPDNVGVSFKFTRNNGANWNLGASKCSLAPNFYYRGTF